MIYAWVEWPDLEVPDGVTLLSENNYPLESSDLTKIDFFVPTYLGGAKALSYNAKMPSLQVLQVLYAGYDDTLPYLRPGLTICNARGVHNASTAELAVGLSIASRRGLDIFLRNQLKNQWIHECYPSLTDSKVGIIGYGSIGKEVARKLSGFDVSITAFTQSGRDGTVKIDDLDKHLPQLDIVILILPLTDASRHMFNGARLASMKDGALIVNVARGAIIDTEALIKELNSRRIYAALDVTDPEPLPQGHPFWSAPNLIIAPHVGGHSKAFEPRGRALIESQLKLFASGRPLEHVVAQG